MALREHELDLVERAEEIADRLDDIEERKAELEERARVAMDEDDLDAPPDDVDEEWSDLDAEQTELEGERKKFIEEAVGYTQEVEMEELWDEADDDEAYWEHVRELYSDVDQCVFTVKELTFGQLQRVSDDMVEESFEVDVQKQDIDGTPRQGFYQTELLSEAIVGWPKYAPERQDRFGEPAPMPGDYAIPVGEWLFEKVDAFNTTGTSEMGNSSLEEALKSKR